MAKKPKLRVYGHQATIHGTQHLDVEVDENGQVVAVWFRCQPLPFKQALASKTRAREMRDMYKDHHAPALHAVVLGDSE